MPELLTNNLHETISTATLTLTQLPGCKDISLYLIAADYPKGRLPEEEMQAILARPAYWAFCWASGLVMAQYMQDNPGICAGKTILDLGAGSGVVAIAAAKSGASQVIACDTDQHALDACRANAEANEVTIELLDDLARQPAKVDLLIAADVLYDRENLSWLDQLSDYAGEVLVADSRIRDPKVFADYEKIAEVEATTVPDLDELKEFGRVNIYRRNFL